MRRRISRKRLCFAAGKRDAACASRRRRACGCYELPRTFTVTSAGKLGGLFHTPIVNYPEVAILGVGRIAPRPVVRDGELVVRSIGTIAVTFDHRVIDGARAAEFGLSVIHRLEAA